MVLLEGYSLVLIFILGGVVFLLITLSVGKILRPNNPNEEKLSSYESGEVPLNNAWKKFDPKFYIVAIIFLLFEAELVFLFPWSIVLGDSELIRESKYWAQISIIESFVFVLILSAGLLYVWKKGMLNWIKPKNKATKFEAKIPESIYVKYNNRY